MKRHRAPPHLNKRKGMKVKASSINIFKCLFGNPNSQALFWVSLNWMEAIYFLFTLLGRLLMKSYFQVDISAVHLLLFKSPDTQHEAYPKKPPSCLLLPLQTFLQSVRLHDGIIRILL